MTTKGKKVKNEIRQYGQYINGKKRRLRGGYKRR